MDTFDLSDFVSELDFATLEPKVNIQLPSEMWSNPWEWEVDVSNLGSVLSKLPAQEKCSTEEKSPVSSQQISGEEWDSEGGSGAGSIAQSFNSVPSACDSLGYSFNSVATSALDASASPQESRLSASDKGKKEKPKKLTPQTFTPESSVPNQPDDKDLDYKKYKTRLCRNWQQTGKCPYGDACVYAHGVKEVRGEQENEAVVTSLSKLADQLTKQMGAMASRMGSAPPALRPLRYRKPKATKKTRPVMAEAEVEPQYVPMQYAMAPPMYAVPMYYPWAQ